MRGLPLLLALAAAGCATPRDPLEERDRVPSPGVPAGAAPAVLPPARAALVEGTLAAAEKRGRSTLADCVRIAEAVHEDLLSGEEDRLQAYLRRDLALASVFPRIAAKGTYFFQNTVRSPGAFNTAPNRTELSASVLQPLFSGFREFHAMAQSLRTAEAREAALEEIRRGLAASVARSYHAVLLARVEIRTLEESLRLDDARLEEMRARVQHGLARRTETLLFESRKASTEAALVRARTDLQVARLVLDDVVGAAVPGELDDSLPALPADVPGRAEAAAEAVRLRPDLRAALLDSEAAVEALRVVRGEYWPTLSLGVNAYPYRHNYSRFSEDTDWDATLTVTVPIFEGGATRARERIAESELRRSRLERSALVRRVLDEVERARTRAASGDALLRAYGTTVGVARENLRLLQEENRQGLTTNLEVLTARNDLEDATRNLERQQIQSRLDRLEFWLAMGRTEILR